MPELTMVLESLGVTIKQLMKIVMQPCNEMMKKCFWLNLPIPCEKLFSVSRSSEGFCCSFNYKGIENKQLIKKSLLLKILCL